MKPWQNALLKDAATLRDAIAVIDGSGRQIALVVDHRQRLLGTVTDGDVRRAILRGLDLAVPVGEVMHREPTVALAGESREAMLAMMRHKRLQQIPLVDADGVVVGLETLNNLLQHPDATRNWAVLMAGGLGSRLAPLTADMPKPMLHVGNKPLLETIIESLVNYSFTRIYIAVNYKAELVKERFGDGSAWGIEIRYLEEDRRLGTAGALGLIPETPPAPLLVMNADLLTNLNFRYLLEHHVEHAGKATVCVREHAVQVPYGVVEVCDQRMVSIQEKPVHRHFINAGIYVLDPDVLSLVPRGEAFDMTTLLERLMAGGRPVSVFPLREFWLDIGHHEDYAAANGHYERLFK